NGNSVQIGSVASSADQQVVVGAERFEGDRCFAPQQVVEASGITDLGGDVVSHQHRLAGGTVDAQFACGAAFGHFANEHPFGRRRGGEGQTAGSYFHANVGTLGDAILKVPCRVADGGSPTQIDNRSGG